MNHHANRIAVRHIVAALLGSSLGLPVAHAASGSYQGIIDADSGLGFMGQTMRVDFVYDETTPPSGIFGGTAFFDGFLTAMSVSIGASTWNWDPAGYSSMSLTNDSVLVFANGVEDRVSAYVDTFNGPSLVAPPVQPEAYFFDFSLYDNLPNGNPDGLAAHVTLPMTAPNPDLFRIDGNNENRMSFRFYTGDPEVGNQYAITAQNVALVPEPSAVLMMLAGIGMIGMVAGRRRSRRP
ncbi:PEP-CTERM sorting domain-containing protein [Comamonadaceae bacterium G21597-S1]|nr:PEP-CTERM sorting domain-containing protein [Comamonadaceae bacterium G21597-S1]